MKKAIVMLITLLFTMSLFTACSHPKKENDYPKKNQSSIDVSPSNKSESNFSKKTDKDLSTTSIDSPINPWDYQKLLGKGMDVDWSKTSQGQKYYNEQAVKDFKEAGISHVRIRITQKATEELLDGLDKQVTDCLKNGIIPIIAYQADDFKNDPSEKNIEKVVNWWTTISERYKNYSHLLSFDLLIEATDALNKKPEKLNDLYERIVPEIRKMNPTRIIIISPRLRSDADYLKELKLPTKNNGYLMAEWHFYASGPSKTNKRKLWTTGTKKKNS
ncbi:glycoside hydrolase family 5 protein (plasmid) [Haloimpatiens sp. FM7330]|uniref:glycoside hydrolase family 5 protein n=1 Tax=Haloimpatiens sp. FM7330 TaxID=3298610 RepID=UPI0036255EE2